MPQSCGHRQLNHPHFIQTLNELKIKKEHLSVHPFTCLSTLSFVRPYLIMLALQSIRPSAPLSVRLSVCPSVRPSVLPSVQPSVLLSARPSVHPSVLSINERGRTAGQRGMKTNWRGLRAKADLTLIFSMSQGTERSGLAIL